MCRRGLSFNRTGSTVKCAPFFDEIEKKIKEVTTDTHYHSNH